MRIKHDPENYHPLPPPPESRKQADAPFPGMFVAVLFSLWGFAVVAQLLWMYVRWLFGW